MELLTPGVGLVFWQIVVFGLLFFLLRSLAWNPILNALRIREDSIQEALDSAKSAKEEMAELKSENEKLLTEARLERDKILKDATAVAGQLKDEAKEEASKIGSKMIEDARNEIEAEKKAALSDVKAQVVSLSVEIAEKLITESLKEKDSQKELVERYLKEKSVN